MTRSKKRLPSLASLLIRDHVPTEKEKVTRMQAALEVLSQQYGIPLRPLTPNGPKAGTRG